MKKQKSIRLFAVLLIAVAPFFLGGCAKKCPKPAANIPGTSAFRSDCPAAETVGSGGLKELNFYYVFDNTDAFKEQIQAFQSQNPGLVIRPKKFADLKEYEDLIVNEIAEGEGPDVFMLHNSWVTKHAKKLLPEPMGLPVTITPEQFRQTFFQAAADDLIIDEKIYGMPMSMDNLAIYYNKQIFKDLLATTDHPGQLWEQIKEQVFQLTKKDNSPERFALAGIALGRSDNVTNAVDTLYVLMLQFGTRFYDDKEERAIFAGSQTGDISKPGVAAMDFLTSFALPSYKHYSWNETITGRAPDEKDVGAFTRGKVAMIIGYPYLYDVITQNIQQQQKLGQNHIDSSDIGLAPLPQLVNPSESTRRDTLASYFPLVVSRNTRLPQEAWTFVQYMTSADALQTYHKKTHRPTSRKDMVTEQQTDPVFGAFAFQAPFAKTLKIYDAAAYYRIFSDAIAAVGRNLATPEQAMQEAEKKVTCVIRKQKNLIDTSETCL